MSGEGNHHVLFWYIFDHRQDGTEVKEKDTFITTRTRTNRRRDTAKGIELLVQCKDVSTTWVTFKDMKNLYPVHMAKYVVQFRIAGEPTFAWWIQNVLAMCNRVIVKLKSKYWLRTHKFGVKIPKSVQEAKAFDE